MAEPTVGPCTTARGQEVFTNDVALCLARRCCRSEGWAHRLPNLKRSWFRDGDGHLLPVQRLCAHEREECGTEVVAISLQSLLDLLVWAVVSEDNAEHVIRRHVYCLRLNPFCGGAV